MAQFQVEMNSDLQNYETKHTNKKIITMTTHKNVLKQTKSKMNKYHINDTKITVVYSDLDEVQKYFCFTFLKHVLFINASVFCRCSAVSQTVYTV